MIDHDQRFKSLIQEFFGEFLQLFFTVWAERLNCSAVEWLDKEVFPDPPEGERRVLDLVAKLPTRQAVPGQRPGETEHWLALVHIEIESPDWAKPLRPRMLRSYVHLRDKHQLPVLPIGLFLQVGLDGVGIDVYEEHFWELRPVHFEYLYVGLPALDAIKYVEGENWLGVALAALMKIPKEKAAWLGAEALRRIKEAPLNDQKRFLLGECVQAYLPLDEVQQKEFDELLAGSNYQGVTAMNLTWHDKGILKGLEQGRLETLREVVQNLLLERFSPLPPTINHRIDQMPVDQLSAMVKTIARAKSLKDTGLAD